MASKAFDILVAHNYCWGVNRKGNGFRYVKTASNYFEKCFIITRPFISVQDEEVIRSKFFQIKSRKEYVELINELKLIGKTNNIELPEFRML
jgi:hypothetical protein